jgi:hypothetical protein
VAYQIFEKKSVRTGVPGITVLTNGRMAINSSATQVLHKNAVEFVLLLWDEDALRIAFRQITKKDPRAYKISYGTNNSGCSFSAKSFLDHIGWKFANKQYLPAEWNEDEAMLEAKVKPEYLKDARQQKLLPVDGGRKAVK